MPVQTPDKRGPYVKADIDLLTDVAVKMIRAEELERRSKTEHLRALRLAEAFKASDQ
ncbi:hypothetical protein [Pararhizobium sp. PWRC1-1]|uniref:hypothetical protein n=1 Tax=Pararhizobium sp. PWRC1-1 TaxID=2804566 RepID=UPI003CF0E7F6